MITRNPLTLSGGAAASRRAASEFGACRQSALDTAVEQASRTERLRRILLASDERSPLGWEKGLSLASLKPMRANPGRGGRHG